MNKDELYMKRAIKLALKAKGKTSPNPLVGSLIVKNNRIIGEGHHLGYGKSHAEIEAINSVKGDLKGSDLYITLEPCNFYGKTPPCVEKIESLPFNRIIIGMKDPNPKVNGKSILRLKQKGYNVTVGVLEKRVRELNPFYEYYIKHKKVYYIMKIAQSIDGYIGYKNISKFPITSINSKRIVHKIRYDVDAILIGANTVNVDNPILNTRYINKHYLPKIFIADFNNKLNYNKHIFIKQKRDIVIFISKKYRKRVMNDNVKYVFIDKHKDMWEFLNNHCKSLNIMSVLIEGGKGVFSNAIENKIFNELIVFISPIIMGYGVKAIESKLKNNINLELLQKRNINKDIMLRYKCSVD